MGQTIKRGTTVWTSLGLVLALTVVGCSSSEPVDTQTTEISDAPKQEILEKSDSATVLPENNASVDNKSGDGLVTGEALSGTDQSAADSAATPDVSLTMVEKIVSEFPVTVERLSQGRDDGKYDWQRYVVVLDGGPVLIDFLFDIDGTELLANRSAAAEQAFSTFGYAKAPHVMTSTEMQNEPDETSPEKANLDELSVDNDVPVQVESAELVNSNQSNSNLASAPDQATDRGTSESISLQWMDVVQSAHLQSQLLPNLKPDGDEQVTSLIAQYDTNEDSVVQASEFLNWLTRGITRRDQIQQTEANQFRYANRDESIVFQRIDVNQDGKLNEDEINKLPKRIKGFDRNNDFLIGFDEIVSGFNSRNSLSQTRLDFDTLVFNVNDGETNSKMRNRLEDEYGSLMGFTESCFPTRPELFHELNENHDDELDADEFLSLLDRPSEILIHVGFRDLELEASQPNYELNVVTNWDGQKNAPVEFDAATDSMRIWDLQMDLSISNELSYVSVSDQVESVKSQLGINELATGKIDQSVFVFGRNGPAECFDLNGDLEIDSDEIRRGVSALAKLTAGELRMRFFDPRDAWFRFIDADRNSLLTELELETSVARIHELASEHAAEDMEPEVFSSSVALPQVCYIRRMVAASDPFEGFSPNVPFTNRSQAIEQSPDWFVAMDLNADGFVAFREFLGDRESFEKFDGNNDGIIDVSEVILVESNATQN